MCEDLHLIHLFSPSLIFYYSSTSGHTLFGSIQSASPSTFLIIWPGKIPPWPSLDPHHQLQLPHHLQQPHICLSPTKLTADALNALTPRNNDSSSLLSSGLGKVLYLAQVFWDRQEQPLRQKPPGNSYPFRRKHSIIISLSFQISLLLNHIETLCKPIFSI